MMTPNHTSTSEPAKHPRDQVLSPRSDEFVEALVLAYHRGLLVPFLGAGMSMSKEGGCPGWADFVEQLSAQANVPSAGGGGDLPARAARSVRMLRSEGHAKLAEAVKRSLCKAPLPPPAQARALAKLQWPLVVTTNYDDLYIAAAHAEVGFDEAAGKAAIPDDKEESALLVLGRSRTDCQRLLTSLRQPDVQLLWALQGFVGGQAASFGGRGERAIWDPSRSYEAQIHLDPPRQLELEKQLVVGHAEYRRVALAEPHFRRAFAELFRSRSLLFLGAGLEDKYFLDLFGEVVELYGASPLTHYAVVCKADTLEKQGPDPRFLQDYFDIRVLEIHKEELSTLLGQLYEGVRHHDRQVSLWGIEWPHSDDSSPGQQPGLRIVRGRLPSECGDCEWVVFSGGGTEKRPRVSKASHSILKERRTPLNGGEFYWLQRKNSRWGLLHGWHLKDKRFRVLGARMDPWTREGGRIRPINPDQRPINKADTTKRTAGGRHRRDLRLIAPAVEELMEKAAAEGIVHVHTMLLAAGKSRTFPQSSALQEMLRGWARWRARNLTEDSPGLSIYLVADSVLLDLDSGRLDINNCLCWDRLAFWLEFIDRTGGRERHLRIEHPDRPLVEMLREMDVTEERTDDWVLELTPAPCLDWGGWSLAGIRRWEQTMSGRFRQEHRMTIEQFGIIAGATLTIRPRD